MPFVSAGVYVREFDYSQYVPLLASSICGCLGQATKGTPNVPVMITNEDDLIQTFGRPITTDYGLYGAIQYLRHGRQLLFMRVTDGTEVTADVDVTESGPTARSGAMFVFDSTRNVIVMFGGNTGTESDPVYSDETWEFSGSALTWTKKTPAHSPSARAFAAACYDAGTPRMLLFGGISVAGSLNDLWSWSGTDWTQITYTGAPGVRYGAAMAYAGSSKVVLFGGINSSGTYLSDTWELATTVFTQKVSSAPSARAFHAMTYNGSIAVLFGGATTGGTLLSDTWTWTAGSPGAWADVTPALPADSPAARKCHGMYYDGTDVCIFGGVSATARLNTVYKFHSSAWSLVTTTGTAPSTRQSAGVAYDSGNSKMFVFGGADSNPKSDVLALTGTAWTTAATTGATCFTIAASSPGTWANGLQVTISNSGQFGYYNVSVTAVIDDQGRTATVETFRELTLDSTSRRYLPTAITDGISGEIRASRYITVTPNPSLTGAYAVTLGTYTLAGGTNGGTPVAADYIGTYNSQSVTGLEAFANAEYVDVNLLMVPGVSDASVVNKMLTVCEDRHDCFAIIDPPYGLDVQGVIDWHNGTGTYTHQSFNTSFGALYWSWIQVYDPYNAQNIWLPPSGFVAAACAYTDYQNAPWWAPAGFVRGRILQALRLEMSPDLGQRDYLYGNQNAVNPIVNFVRDGITIWGQRTLQRMPSALDRVNVRRGLLYIEKIIATAMKYLTFDPNDKITWARAKALIEPALDYMKANRGLYEYGIICDETTNTPYVIDNNEMHVKIWVKPTKAAEKIVLDFVILSTGATFTEIATTA